ncbi:MAG TPA: biopolymer transporter ExbD [Planctomycetota bacterium]|nr:biopolymer transporter ExbD [Planctomycetota bacterium]
MADRTIDDPRASTRSGMNMTPMIDVTFQLIIVFLCSMKFRTLDEKVEAFLPEQGIHDRWQQVKSPETVARIRLDRPAGAPAARLWLHGVALGSTAEGEALWTRLGDRLAAMRARDPALVGEIDAGPEVEHGEVVRAVDGLLGAKVESVRFRGTRPR